MTTQLLAVPSTLRSTLNRIPHGLVIGLLVLAVGSMRPAQAQTESTRLAQADTSVPHVETMSTTEPVRAASRSITWQSNFDTQAAQVLRDADAASTRATVLHNVISVAMQRPNGIDLTETVGALLTICETNPDEAQRVMAIQALHVIGTDHARDHAYRRAMERLHRVMEDEPSERVRRTAATTLQAFFNSPDAQ